MRNSGTAGMDFFRRDYFAPDPTPDDSEEADEEATDVGIVVPVTAVHLTEEEIADLRATIDPLSRSDEYGLDLYQAELRVLSSLGF